MEDTTLFKSKNSLRYLSLIPIAASFLLFVSCATAPTKKLTPRQAFEVHWKEAGEKVQVIQVLAVQNGMYRGNGLVDGRPQEEFYNPSTGEFSPNAPANGYAAGGTEQRKALYKDIMNDLAADLNKSIPADSRVAILKIPSDAGQESKFSSNLASKLEMGLINLGRSVVDRAKMDQVLKEHQLQQSQSALFDASTSARLGKFVGANVVLSGDYHVSMPHKVTVTVKAISVETTQVLIVKDKDIPLDGEGADNHDEIVEMTTP